VTIADLVAQGRLEPVAADDAEARDLLAHAERHLRSARLLLADDPAGAYQLLYDAARKAASADMLAHGLRARANVAGAHAAVVAYAEEALGGEADARALARFDGMRRARNRSEYGGVTFGRAQVEADLAHAAAIVAAVRGRLGA